MRLFFVFSSIAFAEAVLSAQSLVGAQRIPAAVSVSPGMIATFQIPGLDLRLDQPVVVVKDRPLPFEVAGVSLQLRSIETGKAFPVAIFSMRQIDDCPPHASQPRCRTTFVTAQVPNELEPFPDLRFRDARGTDYLEREDATFNLEVTEAGEARARIPVSASGPSFRILTLCDSVLEVKGASSVKGCPPLVTDSDRRLLWGVGLGQTYSVYLTVSNSDIRFKTGQPSPGDPPLEIPLKLYGSSEINSPVLIPFGRNSLSTPVLGPFQKGLFVPGEVGVFRVDLKMGEQYSLVDRCLNGFDIGAISNYAIVILPAPGSQRSQGTVPYASLGLCVSESPRYYEPVEGSTPAASEMPTNSRKRPQ